MDDRPEQERENVKVEDPGGRLLYQRYPGGPRVFVGERGGIGVAVGGSVIVMPLEAWYAIASKQRDCLPLGSCRTYGPDKMPQPRTGGTVGTKTDSRAEVTYRETGDVVEVVALQGFLSLAEIQDRYGRDVLHQYQGGRSFMYAIKASALHVGVSIFYADEYYRVVEQQRWPRSDFYARLQMMRECGNRLAQIVKASRATKLICVKI